MHLAWTLVTIVQQRASQRPELVGEVSALGPKRGCEMVVYAFFLFSAGQGHLREG